MNTGQKLVALSGLSSGSALAHLLAVQQGGGTGPGATIFASQMTVWREDMQTVLVRLPARISSDGSPRPSQIPASAPPKRRSRHIEVHTRVAERAVLLAPIESAVVTRAQRDTAIFIAAKQDVVRRPLVVLPI